MLTSSAFHADASSNGERTFAEFTTRSRVNSTVLQPAFFNVVNYANAVPMRSGRFLRRDALQCKAQYCYCMSSVCLSVCNVGG